METFSAFNEEPVELPPGFRFHPTDEELITHYLCRKVVDCSFITRVVGEVDLNKVEPWDLPWKARMGEKEWYFFCLRDRKYPTGSRTNRATEAGYWKATGKDKDIFRAKLLVGMKKTLVFYRGRAPKGEKTNWVMHEFRLEGKNTMQSLPKNAKKEWVICRVFKKSSGGKKVHISGLVSHGGESEMPPLMELSCDVRMSGDVSHETSLSNHEDKPYVYDEFSSSSCKKQDSSPFSFTFAPQDSTSNSVFSPEIIPPTQGLSNQDGFLMHDQSILRFLLDENVSKSQGNEMGFNGYDDPIVATAPSDGIDCFWNY